MTDRKAWTPTDVVDVSGPPALLRNYLEQRDVRGYLQRAVSKTPIAVAYDVGCGFGRLTPVLSEQAATVVGFEREAALLATARVLLPALDFRQVPSLESLPVADHTAQFVLTFTVLQHMPDPRTEAVIREITRVLAPGRPRPGCRRNRSVARGGRRRARRFSATRAEDPASGTPRASRASNFSARARASSSRAIPVPTSGPTCCSGRDNVGGLPRRGIGTRRRLAAQRQASSSLPTACTTSFIRATSAISQRARAEGDVLIVGVNSDRSVRANKGPARPINPEGERAEMIAALAVVDLAVVFDEDTPYAIINRLLPDVLVKGADWAADQIVGRDVVEAHGGRVVRAQVEEGYSTSAIVDRVRALNGEAAESRPPGH